MGGSDNVAITLSDSPTELIFVYHLPDRSENKLQLYIALGTHRQVGAAVLPFSQGFEGSTVFLPFKGDLLLSAEVRAGQIGCFIRKWERWQWSERAETRDFEATIGNGEVILRVPRGLLGGAGKVDCVIYAKDPTANNG